MEGTLSNYNGIGARVEIIGDWGLQIRDIKSGLSYGIANSLFFYFVLGNHESIDNIFVTWPSGIREEFGSFSVNEHLILVEGTGTTIVGVGYLSDQIEYRIFPNPASDMLEIQLQENYYKQEELIARILDVNGKQVFSKRLVQNRNKIDVSIISGGSYFLELISDSGSRSLSQVIIY